MRSAFIAALTLTALTLFSAAGLANANEFYDEEAAAQRMAVRVLDALKPIEGWLDRAPVKPRPLEATKPLVKIVGSQVNLRSGPTIESEVVAVAEDGEVYEYVEAAGDWYLIIIDDDRRAYVSRRFAQVTTASGEETLTQGMTLALKPGFEGRVGAILSSTQPAVMLLERLAGRVEDDFKRRYGKGRPDPGDSLGQAELRSLTRIRKYLRVAREKYDYYAPLVEKATPTSARYTGRAASIRGTIRAGLGSNTATAEMVDGRKTETDVTRSDLAVDITADLSPDDQLTINLRRFEEIRYAPMSQTRGAVNYTRRLGDQAMLGGRVGFDQYKNDANDLTDVGRTEVGVRGGIAPSKNFRANADFAVTGASYANQDDLDYKDSRLTLGAGGEVSQKASWGFEYGHASHNLEDHDRGEDNVRDNLSGNFTFQTGDRSTLAVIARSDGTTFDDDHPDNYRRRGLEVRGRNRSGIGHSSTWALTVRSKGHDVLEDRNYTEFRGDLQTRSGLGTNQERSTIVFVNYRNFEGKDNTAYLDYIEGRWDSRRARSTILWESNTYMQYFFKNGPAERNARINQFIWCGFMLAANQAIVVGPYLATNTELVTGGDSDDGVFESPSNSVRYGIKGNARITANPLTFDGQVRYEKILYYNIDDASAPTRLELEGRALYTIALRLDASAEFKYYSVGADDPGSTKSSEFDILFGLIYHLGR